MTSNAITFGKVLPLQPEELEARETTGRKTFLQWLQSDYYLSQKVHGLAPKWSLDYGPFWAEIAEVLDDATTREVWVHAPAQAGKSTMMTGWLGHTVEHDPVPFGLVMPRDDDAAERVETHIIPMFESNPQLLRHVGNKIKKINVGKMTMFDNMAFYLLFASSAAAMSGKSICKIGLDENGKFPARVGREADPINLSRDRLETFKGRSKLFGITTPVIVGDRSDIEWKKGDRCLWSMRCVHCEKYHIVKWSNVTLDKCNGKLLAPKEYEAGGCARYICPGCKEAYIESERWLSVVGGKWQPTAEPALQNYRSFRIHALDLHPAIQTVDYLAAKWAVATEAKERGDTAPLQAVINSRFAESWEVVKAEPDHTKLFPHIVGCKRGVVPAGGRIVTNAVDVQLDHVWFASMAWGYQFEGWLLDARRIETGSTEKVEAFEAVRPYIEKGWDMEADPDSLMLPTLSVIDAGYNTDQVYTVCRSWSQLRVFPIMGYAEDRIRGRLYRPVKLSDGLVRYDLNADRFKDSVHRQLYLADVPGPGFLHLFEGIEEELLRQLASEKQVPASAGRRQWLTWIKKDGHAANHLWDLMVYLRFLAEIAGVPAIENPNAQPVAIPNPGRAVGQTRKPIRRH